MIRLKLWRVQAGLTQAEAATRLGVGLSAYALLEAGRLHPSPDQAARLGSFFGSAATGLFEPVRDRVEPQP
jgi:transcriptional regulator with XRE-family HTH domain